MNTVRRLPFVNRSNSDELEELCYGTVKQQKLSARRSRKDTCHNAIQKPTFAVKASDETASTVSISSLSFDDENDPAKDMSFTNIKLASRRASTGSPCNQPPRTPSDSFASKAVFFRHLIGPAIKVQAAVRGWIQMKKYRQQQMENLRQQRIQVEKQAAIANQVARSQATLLIQSMARGWFARQRRQIFTLEAKLRNIQHCHRVELGKIEAYKQREMKRICNEIMAPVLAEAKRLQEMHESRLKLIAELREENAQLREENETLRAASLVIANTNQRSMALLDQTMKNIQELQQFLPRVQADLKKHQAEVAEWQEAIQEYKQALETYKERFITENKIRKLSHGSIRRIVQVVGEGCMDMDLTKSIIRMAKKKRNATSQ